MPGPFPGMDPYLEDPVYWPDIHQSLISAIRGQLNSRLPDNYVAHTGERIIIETRERDVYPDLTVFQRRDGQSGTGGGLLLADPYTRITVLPSEMREPFIEVIAIKPHRAVVATIEVLSPANKRTGTDGRSSYLEKQSALLSSEIHLVEIDLLRTGAHTVAAPEARIAALGRHDYRI